MLSYRVCKIIKSSQLQLCAIPILATSANAQCKRTYLAFTGGEKIWLSLELSDVQSGHQTDNSV